MCRGSTSFPGVDGKQSEMPIGIIHWNVKFYGIYRYVYDISDDFILK